MYQTLALLTLTAVGLIGCATPSSHLSVDEKDAGYQAYITRHQLASVRSIKSFKLTNWQGLTERHLLITSAPNRDYLISLRSRCSGLGFADWISMNRFDAITFQSRSDSFSGAPQALPVKCYIDAIYPLTPEQVSELKILGQATTATEPATPVP